MFYNLVGLTGSPDKTKFQNGFQGFTPGFRENLREGLKNRANENQKSFKGYMICSIDIY